jgi:hypothetical protein
VTLYFSVEFLQILSKTELLAQQSVQTVTQENDAPAFARAKAGASKVK